MTVTPHRTGLSIATAVVLMGASAVFAAVEFAALAKPTHYSQRMAAATAQTESLRRQMGAATTGGRYGWDAICRQPVERAVLQARQDLNHQAELAKLGLNALEVGPDYQSALGQSLAPLRVRFEARGGYDGALALLAALAQSRPTLFIDSLDLSSQTSSVTLKLSGRVYCSAGT